jgi:hypothetical protein
MLLRELKEHNKTWFNPQNKRLFGDKSYKVLHGQRTGNPYLIRSTTAWTDMFDGVKKLHYRINPIRNDFQILLLIDSIFYSLDEIQAWVKIN